MTSGMPASRQRSAAPDLVTLSEKDIGDIACFIARQSGRTREAVESHLKWFLLENAALQPEIPLGFGLRSADRPVGCILCNPQNFHFHDETIFLVGSSSFYVDETHRGAGGRIFLQYCRLGNRHPLFGTSANPAAAALWKSAGASPIPYSDGELFGVHHWPPVAEEFVHRRYSNPILARMAGSSITNLAGLQRRLKIDRGEAELLHPLNSAEQVMDLPIHGFAAKLTASRDLPYIRWRYFSGVDATVMAFSFRSRTPGQDVLITVNQRRRGYREQIKTLNVLDVYPEVGPEDWLRIVGALVARFRKDVDAIVLRNQSPDQRQMLCARGFQLRAFDAPLGWFLDRARLLPNGDWYPVPADGDAII
jgi:hypothetical protein